METYLKMLPIILVIECKLNKMRNVALEYIYIYIYIYISGIYIYTDIGLIYIVHDDMSKVQSVWMQLCLISGEMFRYHRYHRPFNPTSEAVLHTVTLSADWLAYPNTYMCQTKVKIFDHTYALRGWESDWRRYLSLFSPALLNIAYCFHGNRSGGENSAG